MAPLSHACYFEPGAHPYVLGVDNPDGSLPPVLPQVEPFGAWDDWTGRWGSSTGVGSRFLRGPLAGRFGGRSPASPGQQGRSGTTRPRGTCARGPRRRSGRAAAS